MKEKKIIKGRLSKYVLKYGKTLKEIAIIFGVSPATISTWVQNPEKKKWFERKLKANK